MASGAGWARVVPKTTENTRPTSHPTIVMNARPFEPNSIEFERLRQAFLDQCQGKVEMSPSRQNRNVPFSPGLGGVHVNLRVPVKRRRAMLASNPIKEWPAGTHRGRWAGRVLPARPIAWPGPDREAGPPHQ